MYIKLSMPGSCRVARLSAVSCAGLIVASVMFAAAPLRAANYTWVVPSGDWSIASNWGGTLPTGSGTAYVVNGGTASVSQIGEVCNILSLGSSAGSGTVQMTGGGLSVTFFENVGDSGTGAFMQSGGTNSINNGLYVGNAAGSSGTYSLSGSSLLWAPGEYVGNSGTGTFTQSDGVNTCSNTLTLGSGTGASGTYNLIGSSQLSTSFEYVGYSGTGAFTQSGGTNSCSSLSGLYLGYSTGSSGSYSLSGSGQVSAVNMSVGSYGTGTFTQTGGTNSINNNLYLSTDRKITSLV